MLCQSKLREAANQKAQGKHKQFLFCCQLQQPDQLGKKIKLGQVETY